MQNIQQQKIDFIYLQLIPNNIVRNTHYWVSVHYLIDG